MPPKLDLANIPLEDLIDIHNQVLQRVAAETKLKLDQGSLVQAGHDSHGSNHSNNKITDRDFEQQLAQFRKLER